MAKAKIISIKELLNMKLEIPSFQRPYKWSIKSVSDLLNDIDNAIVDSLKYSNFKYRVGTVILHKENDSYKIIDGQQRSITLALILSYLEEKSDFSILKSEVVLNDSAKRLIENNNFIRDWFSIKNKEYRDKFRNAFSNILEIVLITVDNVEESFQLFDSQNTRGKELDPQDLLKAYHLREMKFDPYAMKHAVNKWESVPTNEITILFKDYLFPIYKWSRQENAVHFDANQIEVYKGISTDSSYSYAQRAKKAYPSFQITEPFISGNDFFEMVNYYLLMLNDVKEEMKKVEYESINKIIMNIGENEKGLTYVTTLFYCAVLAYYDKFHNFDIQALRKMFVWSFMLRCDLYNIGFDSINKYALGRDTDIYTNKLNIFIKIFNARLHNEISNLQINVENSNDKPRNTAKEELYLDLKKIIKGESINE